MIVKPLSRPQWQQLYQTAMVRDFPASELKSVSMLEQLEDKGWYTFLGFYREEDPQSLCAYALFIQTRPGAVLLDYFAVVPSLRGGGIGGEILELLKQWAAQKAPLLLAEVEDPKFSLDETEPLPSQSPHRVLSAQRPFPDRGVRPGASGSLLHHCRGKGGPGGGVSRNDGTVF